MKYLLLIILLGCQLLLLPGKVHGQDKAESIGPNQIKCSITVENDSWHSGKPAYVLIQLENISGKDIKLWASYYFILNTATEEAASRHYQARGDAYWSPAGVVTNQGQLEMVAHDLSEALPPGRTTGHFPNETVSLRKGESRQIKADLTQLLWQERILSVWPNENLFGLVPKGKYWLSLEMGVNKQKMNSNRVEVRIE